MKKISLFLAVLTSFIFSISCQERCRVNELEINELLILNAKEQGVNYCEILKRSLQKDSSSIKQLSLLYFENSVGYMHGEVLVNLIIDIGEQEFLNALQGIRKAEKTKIHAYLDVGLEYGNFGNHNLKDTFPKVYVFLDE